MYDSYANVTLVGPGWAEVVGRLDAGGRVAFVSNTVKGATVVWPGDVGVIEAVATELSGAFDCVALVVMTYDRRVLLYQLYESGEMTDSYVSEHVEELLGGSDAPPGDAERLCDVFGKPSAERRVGTVLAKPATDGQPYGHAANRHGDLCSALGLPLFAVGAAFGAIEIGELPDGPGFDAAALVRTGG